jgi:hypothetical protein
MERNKMTPIPRKAEFLTEEEIKKHFNTTYLLKKGNIIQVQHYRSKIYHYLVENCYGWNTLEMQSINPHFFQNWTGE